MKRLVIITEIISPYRIPLFNALAKREGIALHVIFLAETDPVLRQWHVYKQDIRFDYQVLSSWRGRFGKYNALLNWGLRRALTSASPDVILCGGYNYPASWESLAWARIHGVPFLLWSESTLHDRRSGQAWVELLKSEFLRSCTGFVVPGISARAYLVSRGHKQNSIFVAPNAVDNDLFAQGAKIARQNAVRKREELGLPPRYFLFVGRLVREKGAFDLIRAYGALEHQIRKDVGLVFVGEGSERHRLEQQARSITPGTVLFTGFVHREQLAAYYGLAEALVLPTYTDPWGLVVNEAMSCGLPVIVSREAGCAADLVRDGWNGETIPAGDFAKLGEVMHRLGSNPELCRTMGSRSAEHLLEYSPSSWCSGIVLAVGRNGVTS